jgi:glycosyltransferase involved in cell wall biosynthesis
MRIGVDACCWSNRRGFGRFTRELLRAIIAADRTNEYVFFVDQETAANNGLPRDVQLSVAATRVSPMQAASASGRRSLRDLWALSRQVMKHDLDLFFFPAVYSFFPIFNRTRVIVTIHDMIADHHPEAVFPSRRLQLFWKAKQYAAVRQSDLVLTVSDHSKRQIINYFRLPERRVRVISEASSAVFKSLPRDKQSEQVLSRYQIKADERFLLYVGGISPHKNLKVLIKAFQQLVGNASFFNVRLVLVGDYKHDTFHSDYPQLKQQLETLGIKDKVIFTGFVEDSDLVHIYNAASILVLPSLEEGFGLPVVEAMACGTPVVCSDRGSLPEVLGAAGRYFDPYQEQTLVRVLQEVLGNDALRVEMSRSGLARSEEFRWEAVARKTVSIFSEVAG